ncbi:putative reverse transcriptase domain-containing protein [Tanacetum coccineum]
MMPSTWPVNWLSKQSRVGLPELVKAIKGSGKTTKETTTTTTTTTATWETKKTTTITNNKTGGRKLPGPMLRPQLNMGYAGNLRKLQPLPSFHVVGRCPPRSEGAKNWSIWRRLYSYTSSYEVELADGKVVSTNTVLRGCTLVLLNHVFKIDLLPTRLGSFDVIVGMDWLSYHRAIIDC